VLCGKKNGKKIHLTIKNKEDLACLFGHKIDLSINNFLYWCSILLEIYMLSNLHNHYRVRLPPLIYQRPTSGNGARTTYGAAVEYGLCQQAGIGTVLLQKPLA
jgi:hypothetical protein